ncbi:hypothetical protein HPB49_008867 [Dermacentor silvarum]|uniref:Uncharacterized protein n=1 Tax=Dermacentor silvarum TaxID=543639 RepID=A0ACB8CK47_DERSI|nr:hypothetical protein HPB49_008867 [Dermacentor silvarum]
MVASGASELPAERRKAILLTCLGMEGQRIFSTLKPADLQSGSAPATSPSSTGDTGSTNDAYDSAIALLSDHFKRSVNVIVAGQWFSRRAQHAGFASSPPTPADLPLRSPYSFVDSPSHSDDSLDEDSSHNCSPTSRDTDTADRLTTPSYNTTQDYLQDHSPLPVRHDVPVFEFVKQHESAASTTTCTGDHLSAPQPPLHVV